MKNKTKSIIAAAIISGFPMVAFAQINTADDIIALMQKAVTYMYEAFYIVVVGFILLAAFNYLQGGDNPKKIETAKAQLKYAVIALVIALTASGVATIINTFLGNK